MPLIKGDSLRAVLDDDGKPLSPGSTGRLAVTGPTGCRYLDDPRQRDYVQGGWNVTGDIYRVDDDGYFWFVSRADDMIVSAGYNIAGPEVEWALLAHPAVGECAVIGAPDAERVIVQMGSGVGATREAVGKLVAAGEKVGERCSWTRITAPALKRAIEMATGANTGPIQGWLNRMVTFSISGRWTRAVLWSW